MNFFSFCRRGALTGMPVSYTHLDILQGDMAGVRRGEEQNGIGDLLRAGDFTQRDAELKLLAEAADPLLLCIVADPQGCLLYTSRRR